MKSGDENTRGGSGRDITVNNNNNDDNNDGNNHRHVAQLGAQIDKLMKENNDLKNLASELKSDSLKYRESENSANEEILRLQNAIADLEAKNVSTATPEKTEMFIDKKKDISSQFYFDHELLDEHINQLSKQINKLETFDILISIKKLENDIKVQKQTIQVSCVQFCCYYY